MIRFPWHRLDAEERVGAPILVRELGVWRALKVGRATRRALRAGEPFSHLAPSDHPKEVASRAQIGRAIVLYRALQELVDRERAFAITEKVVIEAACVFLAEQLGPLDRRTLEAIPQAERIDWVTERGDRFPNSTVRWDRIDGAGVDFTVTACRFPRLCAEAGAPELAPIFCAGDSKFFGTVEPDVRLERPHTIAEGASTCAFSLRFADRS